ncbi:MAG: hypothetical protein Q8K58_06035 [Acidimicrobiales bacterium]|nr:hypothetical protein [Acidimicrobiales bacterium]
MGRAVLAGLLLLVVACSDDDHGAPSSSSTAPTTTSVSIPQDPSLAGLALAASDLPAGFSPAADVDDTITAFCAGEDATAGLQASGRALIGFTRAPAGASVIQLVFRFRDGGAAEFVRQSRAILDRCSGVPDVTGLAFTYEAVPPALDEVVAAGTDDHVTRHGVSAGSGSLRIDLAVFHRGGIGQLVAVLGLDLPREEVGALATEAFTAAVGRLAAVD